MILMKDIIESYRGPRARTGLQSEIAEVRKYSQMDNLLLGLGLNDLLLVFEHHKVGLEEFFLMREEDFNRCLVIVGHYSLM